MYRNANGVERKIARHENKKGGVGLGRSMYYF